MIFNYILLLKPQIQVKVDVSESTLTLFLRYLYGGKVDVEEEDIHPITLMELHSLAFQFEQEEEVQVLVEPGGVGVLTHRRAEERNGQAQYVGDCAPCES